MDKRMGEGKIFFFVFITMTLLTTFCFASFDKDPVEATQTDPVPVTEELITREGDPGPASPTFKLTDTGLFFTKKPYQIAEIEESDEESLSSSWDDSFRDWLYWEEGEKKVDMPQSIDEE